jgi:hypothetical protein
MRNLITPAFLTLAIVSCGDAESSTASGTSQADSSAAETSGDDGGSASASKKSSGPQSPWDPSKGTAHVTGVAKFTGDPPKRRKVDMGSDAQCGASNSEPVMDETAIISADGHLQNVFVYVKEGLDAWSFSPPSEPVLLNQVGCTYQPHVLGIQVGQQLNIKNSDQVTHNVHSFSKRNSSFNKGQANGGSDIEVTFKKGEVLIPIKCDMHGWMSSYLGVTESPFNGVSAANGSFDLGKLPPGKYTIEARHELFGKQSQEITVGDGESKAIEFTFSE